MKNISIVVVMSCVVMVAVHASEKGDGKEKGGKPSEKAIVAAQAAIVETFQWLGGERGLKKQMLFCQRAVALANTSKCLDEKTCRWNNTDSLLSYNEEEYNHALWHALQKKHNTLVENNDLERRRLAKPLLALNIPKDGPLELGLMQAPADLNGQGFYGAQTATVKMENHEFGENSRMVRLKLYNPSGSTSLCNLAVIDGEVLTPKVEKPSFMDDDLADDGKKD